MFSLCSGAAGGGEREPQVSVPHAQRVREGGGGGHFHGAGGGGAPAALLVPGEDQDRA